MLRRLLQLIYAAGRDLASGQLTLRAMGLVYTTLLALAPLLAVSFSVLKAFGVHDQLRPLLEHWLEPLGEEGLQITDNVIGFVDNLRVGVLGVLGFALLFYIVLSLLQKVEEAFNQIWRVQRGRPLATRFTDYLSVLLVGPVLVFAALAMSAAMLNSDLAQQVAAVEPFGTLYYLLGLLMPYLLLTAAFALAYLFIPNTRVHWTAALFGAVVAAILWRATGWAFATFVVTTSQYSAVYSGFGILFLFMIWLYLSWLIVLLGARLAWYQQQPAIPRPGESMRALSPRLRERAGLHLMVLIGQRYLEGHVPYSLEALAQQSGLPLEAVADLIERLERSRLLVAVGDGDGWVPARDLERIRLVQVVDALYGDGAEMVLQAAPLSEAICQRFEAAVRDALGRESLRALIVSQNGAQADESAPAEERGG